MFSGTGWTIQFYKGRKLYCRNGETVIFESADSENISFFYKNKCYSKSAIEAINKTLFTEPYDPEKKYYDIYGYDDEGFNSSGYNREGYDREGFNIYGKDKDGYDREGFDDQGRDRDGRLWIEYARLINPGEEKIIHGWRCAHEGIVLKCCDCSEKFIYGYKDAKRIEENEWPWPKRCKKCKDKKRKDAVKYEGLHDAVRNEHAIIHTGREQAFRFRGPYEEI